ncbi:protein transport protein SEC31 [Triticum aestivum]|uniref:protein transport protein SEC31 n=1 Tax=Triticum aestivum TaxID=4565 RepID=UPI001D01DB86|nr:protein transport protein SEC31-like [Triticum aestivum]
MASSSSSSSSSSSMPATAASSSRPPADAAFPVLGSLPPRPPRGGRAAPPRPLRRSKDRRRGGKTPSYTFDRDTVGMSLGSLYGRADDTAAETTAAMAEADAAAGTTSATPPTSVVPATTTMAGTISARPPTCAAPGTFAAAKAVLSGLPALLPAVQVFGDYRFGYTMGDLFQDLEKLQLEQPDLGQHLQAVNEPRHPPPLQFQVQPPLRSQPLQAPGNFNAPPPQFQAPPRFGQHSQVPARPLHQRGASDPARGAAPPPSIPVPRLLVRVEPSGVHTGSVRASAGVLHGVSSGYRSEDCGSSSGYRTA